MAGAGCATRPTCAEFRMVQMAAATRRNAFRAEGPGSVAGRGGPGCRLAQFAPNPLAGGWRGGLGALELFQKQVTPGRGSLSSFRILVSSPSRAGGALATASGPSASKPEADFVLRAGRLIRRAPGGRGRKKRRRIVIIIMMMAATAAAAAAMMMMIWSQLRGPQRR